MTYDTVIVDSHVVLPQGMVDKNIVIDNEKIVGFTNDIPSCDHKINGNGLVSIQGIIDTHIHYGVYSPIDEAAKTESHAAAIGGVTTMMRMLRLGSSYTNSLVPQLIASSQNHYVDYTIHASIFNNEQIDEMKFCLDKWLYSIDTTQKYIFFYLFVVLVFFINAEEYCSIHVLMLTHFCLNYNLNLCLPIRHIGLFLFAASRHWRRYYFTIKFTETLSHFGFDYQTYIIIM